MDATAFIYDLKEVKGTNKTYLIRKVFGFKDTSNHGKYSYERQGKLSPYTQDKWGRSVIITKRKDAPKVSKILKINKISYREKNIKILD